MTTVIDLGNLGAGGFIIETHDSYQGFGRHVSGAGDVNGDGFADVIIGDYRSDKGGQNSGAAYVIYGGASRSGALNVDILTSDQGFTMVGQKDAIGWSSSSTGDVNGDGIADILVGALGKTLSGDAYVVFGRADAPERLNLAHLTPDEGLQIKGHGKERFGTLVSGAGDVNGDGLDDMVFSAGANDKGGRDAGAAYVIYGRADGFGRIDPRHLSPADGFMITGDSDGDYFGNVASAGDINGDGFDDLITSASGSDLGGEDSGAAWVIFGKSGGVGSINLSHFRSSMGFLIKGTTSDGMETVSSAGDINGDGYADLLIGASHSENGGRGGRVFLLYGKENGFGTIDLGNLAPTDGFVFSGAKNGDLLGFSVASAGDVNGDGFDDIVLGAPFSDMTGYNSGAAYVIYGRAGGFSGRINLNFLSDQDGFIIKGPGKYDLAGESVSAAGDMNGDGFADVVLGSLDYTQSWVVYGAAPTGDVTRIGSDIGQTIRGGEGSDRLEGLGGDDVLISAGGNDTVLGGTGNDDINGGDGDDILSGDENDDIIHGGAGTDQLSGGDGNDVLYGGPGKDTATGGAGADSFHFSLGGTAADAANADVVTDFHQAEHDVIDLTDYDADPSTKKITDPFTFIGASSFSGAVGELRSVFAGSDTLVSGDTNGDGAADFTIRLTGNLTLTAADFLFAAGAPVVGAHPFLAPAELTANPLLHLA